MLDRHVDLRPVTERRNTNSDQEIAWSLQEVRIILRKYGRIIGIVACVFFCAALLYTSTATRQYTAFARLLIDTPRNPLSSLENGGSGGGSGGLAVPEVESQLQVIVSDRIAFKVLEKLGGRGGGSIDPPKPGFAESIVRGVKDWLRSIPALFADAPGDVEPERVALAKLMSGLSVRRLGSSYVVEISYSSPTPQLSADIANAFAEAYVQDEVDTKAQIWKRASLWLQDRVNELRARSEEAARAAQDFKAQNGNNAETWPKARELDRTAEAYDSLYSAFLKRYTDSVQQQTFPITQARIISGASRPAMPSQPQTMLILSLMTIIGAGLGTAIAFVRWRLDRTIRSPAQIMRYGIRCLTTLPKLPKIISRDPLQVIRTVLRAPSSQFTENLRLVRAEVGLAERSRPMRLIGVTSALPGEGKTTIAANLAQLFASAGTTLLVDADMRNPRLTQALTPILTPRSLDVGHAHGAPRAVAVPGCPGLAFLGVEAETQGVGSHWFEQGGFEAMLNDAKGKYTRIIVDLPPAGVVAEARYVAPLLDAIIVVVEWETTPAEAFISCIDACDVDPGKVFGVVLNKAHPSLMNYGQGTAYTNQYLEAEDLHPLEPHKGRIRV